MLRLVHLYATPCLQYPQNTPASQAQTVLMGSPLCEHMRELGWKVTVPVGSSCPGSSPHTSARRQYMYNEAQLSFFSSARNNFHLFYSYYHLRSTMHTKSRETALLELIDTWKEEDDAESHNHLAVNTVQVGNHVPAFPLANFKSAVFSEFRIYNETPDDDIVKLADVEHSPYTLFTFNDLQLRVEGRPNVVGDDRVSARFTHDMILPGSEDNVLIHPEQSQAGTVTIGGNDYAMVVLQEILRGQQKDLAAALGVVYPSFGETLHWWTFDVVATTANGFFHKGHLVVIHAELVALSRPWKHLPGKME
ncbi:hypothetical protein P7C70_g7041, partial [Phenoliferia sp. Uapishka_3]